MAIDKSRSLITAISLLIRWQEVLLITISVRILIFIFTTIANQKSLSNFFYLWNIWDGNWYMDIAKNWYHPSGEKSVSIVFYPLYPLLIKLVSFLIPNLSFVALLLSFICSIAAAILIFELTLLDFEKDIALKAVWFLNLFPTSYFLQAISPESLYLTLSIAAIYCIRKNYFFKSGVSGFLAALTRVNGILLLPLLFLESKNSKKNISLFFTLAGFITYLVINFVIYNDFFYFRNPLLHYWYKHFDFPWNGIKHGLTLLSLYKGDYLIAYYFEQISVVFILIMGLIAYFKIRKSYGIYVLLNLLFFTSTSFILSIPRYALVLFPIYIVLGKVRNIFLLVSLSSIFIMLLFYFSYIYTQGRWAF